ncbi:MAG: M1 family peptidase [Dehalococcoidia bacterium]|nr:M1 family peptidase [Dehalococcoidia bacterium]
MTTGTAYRLPAHVKPLKYELTLEPDLEKFTYRGEQTVQVQVTQPTDRIAVNALDLSIADVRVRLPNGTVVPAREVTLDHHTERATFVFGQQIPAGTLALSMTFTGTLNDQLRGFYRSQYTDAEGKQRYLATTQFEATDARRAFPCWDDPAVKATFQVTLVAPHGNVAISNTPVTSETTHANGSKAFKFAETPKMSTYLLLFIVGDMASVEAKAPNGTQVRVWTTRGKEQQGHFALENAVKLLGQFNDYFGIPYPLPKLDHIAIPDFAAGAMENWGAITYRETALLYDPATSAANTQQRVLEVVAHEMAHMWFGDLVTMEWWDDLWLNESFASWMGDKMVDQAYPEWQMWTQFVFQDTTAGLSLDGLRNSHPIEQRVENPHEIRELFDAVSYSKGASVLRMLEDYVGAEGFRAGLRRYIAAHQYGNARTEDLWKALDEASGKPVTTVMNTWIKQMGYPVLQAEAQRRDGDLRVQLSQRHFLYDYQPGVDDRDPALWQVPVNVLRAKTQGRKSSLLTERQGAVEMGKGTAPAARDWFKLNAGQTAFYRVNYQTQEWERLRAAVEAMELPPTDRLGLQDDAYALMRAGMAPATTFLSLASAYKGETDASVWRDLATGLRGMESLLADEAFLAKYQAFARELFQPIARKVGWDAKPGEGHLDAILRSTVLGQAAGYGDDEVLMETKSRFTRFLNDPKSLHPNLRGVVYNAMAHQGDRSVYSTLWDLYKAAPTQEEKMRFLGALTGFEQPVLLQETLERSLGPDVRLQDSVLAVGGVAGNLHGRDLAWEFIKSNWGEFDRRYGDGGFAITRLVATTGGFTTAEHARDVEEFFKTHPAPSATRTIQQSLERIGLNVRWLGRNRKELGDWFAARA